MNVLWENATKMQNVQILNLRTAVNVKMGGEETEMQGNCSYAQVMITVIERLVHLSTVIT